MLVRRMRLAWNDADSRNSDVVSDATIVPSPPITPASASGRSPQQIRRSSAVSVRFCPSSVVSFSPVFARRTRIGPSPTCRASNACIGWPRSSMTQLVRSTGRLIARWPTAASCQRSSFGDGPAVTPSITTPQ